MRRYPQCSGLRASGLHSYPCCGCAVPLFRQARSSRWSHVVHPKPVGGKPAPGRVEARRQGLVKAGSRAYAPRMVTKPPTNFSASEVRSRAVLDQIEKERAATDAKTARLKAL